VNAGDVMRMPAAPRRTRYRVPLRAPGYRPMRYVLRGAAARDFMAQFNQRRKQG
jgi:hypothetical protein